MGKIWPLFVILFFISCREKAEKTTTIIEQNRFIQADLSLKSNQLIEAVRDNKIEKSKAAHELDEILISIKQEWQNKNQKNYIFTDWVFPISGYGPSAIGGVGGSGYIGRYDFFDGNNHTGHTALDIFVADRNQDCLDDNTKRKIPILSTSGGVVLATANNWDTASPLRGGKYIWIYDPANNFMIYYAHNDEILVNPGQLIKPGEQIATCGRSGLNAFKKRSPTHLHFMLLKLDENNYPKPVNPYEYLQKVKLL